MNLKIGAMRSYDSDRNFCLVLIVLLLGAAMLLLLVASMGLLGCFEQKQEATPKYSTGQMVKSVLSGQIGQVIKVYCWDICQYQVRFSSDTSEIPSHILGSGGDMQKKSFSIVCMREFELKT